VSYDANTHYLLMQRRRPQRRMEPSLNDPRASQRIMPGLPDRNVETRMDRILKPYRGNGYEGPTEPEVV
jgi:hypothetical protein